jgi:hypothetical protein
MVKGKKKKKNTRRRKERKEKKIINCKYEMYRKENNQNVGSGITEETPQ